MIAVIDYGMGNVGSIINIFRKIGIESILTNDVEQIEKADKLILPGVGAFDNGMYNLNNSGLADVIKKQVLEKEKTTARYMFGMQLLGRRSEEGNREGIRTDSF